MASHVFAKRAYRIVLPVRSRIHWGMGRFCFCFFARMDLVRKDLKDPWRLGKKEKAEKKTMLY